MSSALGMSNSDIVVSELVTPSSVVYIDPHLKDGFLGASAIYSETTVFEGDRADKARRWTLTD